MYKYKVNILVVIMTAVTRKGPLMSKFHKPIFLSIPISQRFLNTTIQR